MVIEIEMLKTANQFIKAEVGIQAPSGLQR